MPSRDDNSRNDENIFYNIYFLYIKLSAALLIVIVLQRVGLFLENMAASVAISPFDDDQKEGLLKEDQELLKSSSLSIEDLSNHYNTNPVLVDAWLKDAGFSLKSRVRVLTGSRRRSKKQTRVNGATVHALTRLWSACSITFLGLISSWRYSLMKHRPLIPSKQFSS